MLGPAEGMRAGAHGPVGRSDRWPGPDDGYAACDAAGANVAEGSVGAGTGATVGKALGLEHAMKGGVGSWSVRAGDLVVGALSVAHRRKWLGPDARTPRRRVAASYERVDLTTHPS